jgi:hypothetical protein
VTGYSSAKLLERSQVVGRHPDVGDATAREAGQRELLRLNHAAGGRDAEEAAAVGSRVGEVRRDKRRLDDEVAQLPAVVRERPDDLLEPCDVGPEAGRGVVDADVPRR